MANQDIKQKIGEAFYSDPAKLVGGSWRFVYGRRKECPEHIVTDGHTSKKKRGTYISPKSPLYMHDVSTNEGCTCIDWVMRDKSLSYWDAVQEISRVYGLYIPDTYRKETPEQKARRERRKAQETAVISMKPTPQQEGAPLSEEEAYLLGRGITREMQEEWHIGCLSADPAKGALYANFKAVEGILIERSKWNTSEKVAAIGVGSTYTIAIPEFTAGRLTGIIFTAPRARTDAAAAAGQNAPKYWPIPFDIDDTERVRLFGLSGARGNTPLPVLIVVEGTMDAITATEALKGSEFSDVVATNTSHISEKQAEAIHAAGYRAVIIAADYEGKKPERDTAGNEIKDEADNVIETVPAGLEQRARFIRLSAEALRDFGIVSAVADMQDDNPEIKSDAADLIKARGAQEFCRRIKDARPASSFAATDMYNAAELRFGRDISLIPLAQLGAALSEVVAEEDNEQLRAQLLADLAPIAGGQAAAINAVREARGKVEEKRVERAKAREWAKVKVTREKAAKLIVEGKEEEALKVLQEGKALPDRLQALFEAEQSMEYIYNLCPETERIPLNFDLYANERKYQAFVQTSAVTVFAGKSGHGKTTAELNVTISALDSLSDGQCVLFFSCEKDLRYIFDRLSSVYAGRKGVDLAVAKATISAQQKACRLRLYQLDDLGEIATMVAKDATRTTIKAIVIDYIQILRLKGFRGNKKERMEQVCLDLRTLSLQYHTAVIVGAQLNRETPNPLDFSSDNIGDAVDIDQLASETYLLWNSAEKPIPQKGLSVEDAVNAANYEFTKRRLNMKLGRAGAMYVQVAKTKRGDILPKYAEAALAMDAGGAMLPMQRLEAQAVSPQKTAVKSNKKFKSDNTII